MKPDYNSYNPFVWNFDEYGAYLLGLVMADGTIQFQNGCYRMSITLNIKDRDIIDKLYEHYKIGSISIHTDTSGFKEQERIRWAVYDHNLVHGLMYFEVEPHKTGCEVVPQIKDDMLRHFLRGFFDGDGYVHCAYSDKWSRNVHKIGFALNYAMGQSINSNFNRILGISPKKIRLNGKSKVNYMLELSGVQDLEKVYNFFYKDARISLDRKYVIFTELYKGLLRKGDSYHGRVY
jgi:intein-encoded DNA endonuclease-like protein